MIYEMSFEEFSHDFPKQNEILRAACRRFMEEELATPTIDADDRETYERFIDDKRSYVDAFHPIECFTMHVRESGDEDDLCIAMVFHDPYDAGASMGSGMMWHDNTWWREEDEPFLPGDWPTMTKEELEIYQFMTGKEIEA